MTQTLLLRSHIWHAGCFIFVIDRHVNANFKTSKIYFLSHTTGNGYFIMAWDGCKKIAMRNIIVRITFIVAIGSLQMKRSNVFAFLYAEIFVPVDIKWGTCYDPNH